MLPFCDDEVIEALKYHLRGLAVTFRFSETVSEVQKHPAGTLTVLESGKKIPADTVLYSAGQQGVTDELNAAAAGVPASNPGQGRGERELPDRGRAYLRGRRRHRLPGAGGHGDGAGAAGPRTTRSDEPVGKLGDLQPIGIYSIPEISFVGRTETQLTVENVPFEVGVARYPSSPGAPSWAIHGMLKILVHAESRELLGVHVFGTNATELVHIGQTVMGCGGTVDYLVDAVFNYPTLAESYKVAALDAVNKRAIARVTQTGRGTALARITNLPNRTGTDHQR